MKIIYLETREKMEIFDIKFMNFREELNLLWIIKSHRSEKFQNKRFGINIQID